MEAQNQCRPIQINSRSVTPSLPAHELCAIMTDGVIIRSKSRVILIRPFPLNFDEFFELSECLYSTQSFSQLIYSIQ